jgi:hypothetical protein
MDEKFAVCSGQLEFAVGSLQFAAGSLELLPTAN